MLKIQKQKPQNLHNHVTASFGSQPRYRFIWLSFLGLFLVSIIGGTYYHYYENLNFNDINAKSLSILNSFITNKEKPLKTKYDYYVPNGPFKNTLLEKTLSHYNNDTRQAVILLEKITNDKNASDDDKSLALLFIGLIAMKREQYEISKNQFLLSLRYNSQNVGSIVNLAIIEKHLKNYKASRDYALQAHDIAPNDKQMLLLLGNLLLENQETDRAIVNYERAINNSPEDTFIYYNIGLSLMKKRELNPALDNFQKVLQKPGANQNLKAKTHANIGQIYLAQGKNDLAIDYLQKATNLSPHEANYLYNLGVAHLYNGDNNNALNSFSHALKAENGTPHVYRALTKAFQRLDNPELSIKSLKKAIKINPRDVSSLFKLGDLQYKSGNLLDAADNFRKVIKTSIRGQNRQDANYKLAKIYFDLEQYQLALETLADAIKLKRDNPRVYLLSAQIYEKLGKQESAIKALNIALNFKTTKNDYSFARKKERELRLALAKLHRTTGNFSLAFQQYQLISKRNKESPAVSDPQLYLIWGNTYVQSNDYKTAIPLFKKIIKLRSSSLEERKQALIALAQTQIKISRNPITMSKALGNVNKALILDANDHQTLLAQASILVQTKIAANREKAIEILLALTNSEHETYFLGKAYTVMGLAYIENKEYHRAIKSFEYALKINPSNQEALRNQQIATQAYRDSL